MNNNLNPKLFDPDVEKESIRGGYGRGLKKAGEENAHVVALCADLTGSTRTDEFAKAFPERFFQVGVAEQNLAAIAAGLGVSGKIPFISSFAVFSPGRNWEQIRTTVCYNDSNVKIAGHHAGLSTGADGATHQALEDIALMRAIPNMRIFVPCDALEAEKATRAAASLWGPVYLRLAREKTPLLTTPETPFVPGKAQVLWESKKPKAVIFGAGPLLYQAVRAAKILEKEKTGTVVVNVHTIKPLDVETIVSLAKKCGAVITVEEHQISGGLGGAIAETLAARFPVPVEFIGMRDTFGESGPSSALLKKYGMEAADIVRAVKKAIRRK